MTLRHNRVSPLGAERGQDQLGVPGRGDGGRRPRRCPGRPDVVLVVGSGHYSVPPPPGPTACGMALLLTGGRPAGPLPGPEAGMGTEESLAEGTPAAAQHSGHRSPPRWKATPYPICRACAQDEYGEVGWVELRRASSDRDIPDGEPLTVTTAVVTKGDDVDGVAATALRSSAHARHGGQVPADTRRPRARRQRWLAPAARRTHRIPS